MALLFAFSGKMRSGKDTAADYIEARLHSYGYTVKRMMFAGTIKRIGDYIQKECGFPVERDRELYQWLGTDYGRTRNPNVWVDALERQIIDSLEADEADVILVTDLRFPNEFDMLSEHDFTLVRTTASDSIRAIRGAEIDKMGHISETAVDDYDRAQMWDWQLINEGTLSDFHKKLDLVIAEAMLADEDL